MKIKVYLASLLAVFFSVCAYANEQKSPVEIIPPKIILKGIPAKIKFKPLNQNIVGKIIEVKTADGETLASAKITNIGEETVVEVENPAPDGKYQISIAQINYKTGIAIKTIPGWLTVLPPLIAIVLALVFRQVIPALFAGVFVGAWIFYGGFFAGLVRSLDYYIIHALSEPDHTTLLIFLLLFGGMVGLMSRSGGTHGLVNALAPLATNSRRGQLVTWFMDLCIFFDDYANTILVGNTMRPVTDRLKISREKLAYILDSIAAPVCSIGLISTWIGYEVSLIGDSLTQIGSDADAYSIFLRAIAYNFYPILAILMVFMIAMMRREYGPMLKAERRAFKEGKVLSDDAVPLSDFANDVLAPPKNKPKRLINAIIPIFTVLAVTFISLWIIGKKSLIAQNDPDATVSFFALGIKGIGKVFGASDSFKALLYGAMSGCVIAMFLAIGQKIL
ncbi:MAG TPA: Na+/H+ antiporter NhaC family protein, partial [Elusimicrobiales bacterium]|nr:Na+/H+ antiporter NhaC family protein [Elusimicrobiales bacterium]